MSGFARPYPRSCGRLARISAWRMQTAGQQTTNSSPSGSPRRGHGSRPTGLESGHASYVT
eukprot:13094595-Alexandrium_andersonii.AAC.1